ncbi:MAG: nuclear transport factor 2 family protein [Chitinophagaceae bacterium]|nr:MAG: nuclear transport factor 2 family protein [Chitinophagaceae bacterium]
MNKLKVLSIFTLIIAILFSACTAKKENPDAKKKEAVSQELFNEILHMDSVMFDAFNAHDPEKLKSLFSEDLEFYHDKDGLNGYEKTMENFKDLFERNKTTGLRRDLVAGSLEVYPLKDFGAVETCLHRFCHKENGKDDCGTFKNIMIWQKKDSQWKVTRVISYDH